MSASDEYGDYDPDAGNPRPVEGNCNAVLDHHESRYGEKRYCARDANKYLSGTDYPHTYCRTHKKRYNVDMRAKELLQHGLFSSAIDTYFELLDPWQQLIAYGTFESLLVDSVFEYSPEYDEVELDFADTDETPTVPEEVRDGDVVIIEVARPTEYPDRALALWIASCDTVKMLDAQARVTAAGMETTSTEYAEFTTSQVVGENGDGTPKAWQTIEEASEHHLNLPLSRLVRDRKELLEYGGVGIDSEDDTQSVEVSFEDFEDELPDTEVLRGSAEKSESATIVESAGGDYQELTSTETDGTE